MIYSIIFFMFINGRIYVLNYTLNFYLKIKTNKICSKNFVFSIFKLGNFFGELKKLEKEFISSNPSVVKKICLLLLNYFVFRLGPYS